LEERFQQKKELEAYRDSVTAQKPNYTAKQRSFDKKMTTEPVKLVPFNPNKADSLTLRGLGLRSYVVKNILNYRRKGGQFRKPSDLARIYGLEPAVFAKLEQYIQLAGQNGSGGSAVENGSAGVSTTKVAQATSEIQNAKVESSTENSVDKYAVSPASVNPTFDLNTADTTLLQQLKGVGSFTANRIARYRNQLGGFYSMTQLSEIKGLYPETLARLQSMLKIDLSRINTMNVNKASLEKLRAHPYLNFYQAKVIVELRKARGSLHSLDELTDFKEFTPVDMERLKWYLSF